MRYLRLALAMVLLALVPGVAAARPAPMRFTAPRLIDGARGTARPVQALACPSAALCVGSDDAGSVLTTTVPGDASAPWVVRRVDDAGGLGEQAANSIVSLACPTAALCVGVDGDGGDVLSATRPAAGSTAWRRVRLPGSPQLVAVACPSARLCLAADFGGGIDVSTDPTGSARAWRHTVLRTRAPELSALACASPRLCLAGGIDGALYESTDPTGGGATFRRVAADEGGTANAPSIDDVACASTSWCVAVDDDGGALTSTDPAGAASGWRRTELAPGAGGAASAGLAAITCRASGLCATVDPAGDVWASTAAGAAFAQVANGSVAAGSETPGAEAIACPSQALCLVGSASGAVIRSSAPATAGSWTSAPIATDAGPELTGVSCPSTSLCVAADGAGDVYVTTTPTVPASWRALDVDGTNDLVAVSCPTTTFCALADGIGDVVTTTDPTGPQSAWTVEQVVGPVDFGSGTSPVNLTGLACASASLCLTGDEDPGAIITSTDPTGPASAWSATTGIGARFGDDGLDGAACASTRLCVAISGETIHASTAPTTDDATRVTIRDELGAVSCPTRSLCVAAAGDGSVFHGGAVWRSTDPGAAHPRWAHVVGDPHEGLAVACHGTTLCVDGDSGGRALITFAPGAAHGRWVARDVDGLTPITGASCPTAAECVLVDDFGRVLVGRR